MEKEGPLSQTIQNVSQQRNDPRDCYIFFGNGSLGIGDPKKLASFECYEPGYRGPDASLDEPPPEKLENLEGVELDLLRTQRIILCDERTKKMFQIDVGERLAQVKKFDTLQFLERASDFGDQEKKEALLSWLKRWLIADGVLDLPRLFLKFDIFLTKGFRTETDSKKEGFEFYCLKMTKKENGDILLTETLKYQRADKIFKINDETNDEEEMFDQNTGPLCEVSFQSKIHYDPNTKSVTWERERIEVIPLDKGNKDEGVFNKIFSEEDLRQFVFLKEGAPPPSPQKKSSLISVGSLGWLWGKKGAPIPAEPREKIEFKSVKDLSEMTEQPLKEEVDDEIEEEFESIPESSIHYILTGDEIKQHCYNYKNKTAVPDPNLVSRKEHTVIHDLLRESEIIVVDEVKKVECGIQLTTDQGETTQLPSTPKEKEKLIRDLLEAVADFGDPDFKVRLDWLYSWMHQGSVLHFGKSEFEIEMLLRTKYAVDDRVHRTPYVSIEFRKKQDGTLEIIERFKPPIAYINRIDMFRSRLLSRSEQPSQYDVPYDYEDCEVVREEGNLCEGIFISTARFHSNPDRIEWEPQRFEMITSNPPKAFNQVLIGGALKREDLEPLGDDKLEVYPFPDWEELTGKLFQHYKQKEGESARPSTAYARATQVLSSSFDFMWSYGEHRKKSKDDDSDNKSILPKKAENLMELRRSPTYVLDASKNKENAKQLDRVFNVPHLLLSSEESDPKGFNRNEINTEFLSLKTIYLVDSQRRVQCMVPDKEKSIALGQSIIAAIVPTHQGFDFAECLNQICQKNGVLGLVKGYMEKSFLEEGKVLKNSDQSLICPLESDHKVTLIKTEDGRIEIQETIRMPLDYIDSKTKNHLMDPERYLCTATLKSEIFFDANTGKVMWKPRTFTIEPHLPIFYELFSEKDFSIRQFQRMEGDNLESSDSSSTTKSKTEDYRQTHSFKEFLAEQSPPKSNPGPV